MKYILILNLIIFSNLTTFAQTIFLDLKDEPVNIVPVNYYIKNVVDDRAFTGEIGYVRAGIFNKKVKVDLNGGVESAIGNFLRNNLPQDTSLIPVIVVISDLTISEQMNYSDEKSTAAVKLQFYKIIDGKKQKIFEASSLIEESSVDFVKKHESRIRMGITECIQKFNEFERKNQTELFYDNDPDAFITENHIVVPETKTKKQDVISPSNLATAYITSGLNASGWGFTYSRYIENPHGSWTFPLTVSIENFVLNEDYFSQYQYSMADIRYLSPGITVLGKINKFLFVDLIFTVPVGTEKLTDFSSVSSTKYIMGIAPSQGLLIIPTKKYGLTFGLSLYEKILTSEVYKNDLGIKIDFGFKF